MFTKKTVGVLVAFLVTLFIAFQALKYAQGKWDCWASWSTTDLEYRYKLRGGCQVKPINGNWIPERNYRTD